MPSMKTLKRRMNSVTTTKKIMKAMNMVAASKLQKDKAALEAARPFISAASDIIRQFRGDPDMAANVFLKPRAVHNTAYVVITSNRGLCGSYNNDVARLALAHMNEGRQEKIFAIGLKGFEFFRRQRKNVVERLDGVIETAFFEDADRVARRCMTMFATGEVDEVYIAYTQFRSVLVSSPVVERILPRMASRFLL